MFTEGTRSSRSDRMAAVLTENATVLCGPVVPMAHGGTITLTGLGAPKLRVGDSPVLLEASVTSRRITGCKTPDDAPHGNIPCQTFDRVTDGRAAKLTVDDKPVLLTKLTGATSGKIGGTPQAVAQATDSQTKLDAV